MGCACGGGCPRCRGTVPQALQGSGQPLPAAQRREWEPLFGRSLAPVRVHQGSAAARSSQTLGARAYAVGSHIVAGPEGLDTATPSGRALLAHEVAHALQQGPGLPAQPQALPLAGAAPEHEARAAAQAVLAGRRAPALRTAPPALARAEPEAAAAPALGEPVRDFTVGQYVDAWAEVHYDLGYRSEPAGALSKWMRVVYSDGSTLDIHIDELQDVQLNGAALLAALEHTTAGPAGRVYPGVLSEQTTPRLWAARQAVLQEMDNFNTGLLLDTLPVVFTILTLGVTPMAAGAGPRVARRTLPRAEFEEPPGPAAAAPRANPREIGTRIGQEVKALPKEAGESLPLAERVTAQRLPQADAVECVDAAYNALGKKTYGRIPQPDGSVVLTPEFYGDQIPVMVVRADGSVAAGFADNFLVNGQSTISNLVLR